MEEVQDHVRVQEAAAGGLNEVVGQISLLILVQFAGQGCDVLLDELAFADALEDKLLHVFVQPLVNVVNVVKTENKYFGIKQGSFKVKCNIMLRDHYKHCKYHRVVLSSFGQTNQLTEN